MCNLSASPTQLQGLTLEATMFKTYKEANE